MIRAARDGTIRDNLLESPMLPRLAPVLALPLFAACAAPPASTGAESSAGAPAHHYAISTRSPEAQRLFDQGLAQYWSFDPEGALRSFTRAGELDAGCAMLQWAQALAVGPQGSGATMDAKRARAAHEALANALSLAPAAAPLERELVAALDARYDWPPPADRQPLDDAYARALGALWARYPRDAEVGTLYAEALLQRIDYDPFLPDGTPRDPELVSVLERVLTLAPDHPGANHLALHVLGAAGGGGESARLAARIQSAAVTCRCGPAATPAAAARP